MGGCPTGNYQGGPPMMVPQQQPMQGYGQQPNWSPAQQQPAYQAGQMRGYAQGDRLPAMPEMMRRPTTASPAPQAPVVRGAPPEATAPRNIAQTTPPPPASSPGWQPIRIPTPDELGISVALSQPTPATQPGIAPPASYDLGTVTQWLDSQGARSCQREKLAEGVQFVCQLTVGSVVTVKGASDEDALKKLVAEVIRQRQGVTLSQR